MKVVMDMTICKIFSFCGSKIGINESVGIYFVDLRVMCVRYKTN